MLNRVNSVPRCKLQFLRTWCTTCVKICLVKSSSYGAFIMFVFLIQIACYVRCSLPDSQVFCHVDWFCYIWFKSVPTRAISSCSCVQAWQHLKTSIFSIALWVNIFLVCLETACRCSVSISCLEVIVMYISSHADVTAQYAVHGMDL